jgi:signal transduction histidine kinase
MNELWVRNDRPIPGAYWAAAALSSVVVLVCYLTASWTPWFLAQLANEVGPSVMSIGGFLMLILGGGLGVIFGVAPWLALRWPALGAGVALLPVLPTFMSDAPLHFGVFAGLMAVALTASWRSARSTVVVAALAVVVIASWLASGRAMSAPFRSYIQQEYMPAGSQDLAFFLYLAAVALVVLGAWGLRRSAESELDRRALAARSGEVEHQSAVVAERARLARDLHDVVAHHVSLIAVRAETAPYTHPQLGEDARGVLGDIAADARLALDELRGVLGILGRSGDAERAPQPTWSDIGALVERTRSAGVAVEVVGDAGADVGPAAGYAAYRVVQEALTNARKHAPGAPVTVDLDSTSQLLTVQVSTPLSGAPAPATGGQGLVGMRERVEALGGRLLSGPVGDHFVVEAILPRGAAEGAA